MEQVREKVTFKKFLNTLFGNNAFEEDLTEELKKSHLYETMNKLDKMGEVFNTPINSEENKSSKNGGVSKGIKKVKVNEIDPNTLNKMREIVEKEKERE